MSFDRSGAQRRRSRRGVAAFRGVAALLLAATQGACSSMYWLARSARAMISRTARLYSRRS